MNPPDQPKPSDTDELSLAELTEALTLLADIERILERALAAREQARPGLN